jgi:pimeloyl-ACP methyl ester carboxylesterase
MRTHGTVVAADGTRLAYQLDGSGPPLLLLAGQANHHGWWDSVRPDLSDFRTVTLDWRGTGDSEDGAADFTTRTLVADLVDLLDALEIGPADVYGTSMGGRVAQWLAVDRPERVRRLVLGCTTPGGTHAVERSQEVRRRLAVTDRDAAREAVADLMYTAAWRAVHPGPYATLGDPDISAVSARRHLRASARHDAYDELRRIGCPTLVLHGTDDEFAPVVNAQLVADRIPGATLRLFEGARHAYFEECRPEASRVVREFLVDG